MNIFFFLKGFTGVVSKEEFQLKIHGKFLQKKKEAKSKKIKEKNYFGKTAVNS